MDQKESSRNFRERMECYPVRQETTAILVDGGFYLYRAHELFGEKSGEERAEELITYCRRHLSGANRHERNHLYRIFYYDCEPLGSQLYHPFLQKNINMGKTDRFKWTHEFLDSLAGKRKVAIRLGELQEKESGFKIRKEAVWELCRGERNWNEITEENFYPDIVQKGVDVSIAMDIASLANKQQVTQIVLIAGDSDFVPAAKYARREGIDFILDPMWRRARPSLSKHVDGVRSCTTSCPMLTNDPLCVKIPEEDQVDDQGEQEDKHHLTGIVVM